MNFLDKEFEDEYYSDDSLYNLISYGADLTVREIKMMYEEGDMVKPSLQRNFVWTKNEAGRFIDSILLGLPVPSIFLAKDFDSRLLIVDGLQRITTLCDYINGKFSPDNSRFKLPRTESINEKWRGLSYDELSPDLQRRIKGYTIHAIIFERKDKNGHDTAMYQIFERINTGGRVLSSQEIRNCVYHGDFNNLLISLNEMPEWRRLLGIDLDIRMKDVEIILRCFAIAEIVEKDIKTGNLSKYLNEFMSSKRDINDIECSKYKLLFSNAIAIINSIFDKNSNKDDSLNNSKQSILLIESLMVNLIIIMNNNGDVPPSIPDELKIYDLLNDELYKEAASARTTNIANIRTRIERCSEIVFGKHCENDL